jgi:tRNA(Arg) A34 adenosine deaminase TadA
VIELSYFDLNRACEVK